MIDQPLRVTIELNTAPAMVNLRAPVGNGPARAALSRALGLHVLPNTNTVAPAAPGREILGLGPDEWLALWPGHVGLELERELRAMLPETSISICDVSYSRRPIRVTGPGVWSLLATGCALPRSALAPGQCAQTHLAHLSVLLLPVGDEIVEVFSRTSEVEWLFDWLGLRIKNLKTYHLIANRRPRQRENEMW